MGPCLLCVLGVRPGCSPAARVARLQTASHIKAQARHLSGQCEHDFHKALASCVMSTLLVHHHLLLQAVIFKIEHNSVVSQSSPSARHHIQTFLIVQLAVFPDAPEPQGSDMTTRQCPPAPSHSNESPQAGASGAGITRQNVMGDWTCVALAPGPAP